MNKRIDSLGRIVIPKDYRKKLNINDGELLNIEYENIKKRVVTKNTTVIVIPISLWSNFSNFILSPSILL